jgi:hypothetical protein
LKPVLLANLLLGTLLISATVMIHTMGLIALTRWMAWIVHWFRLHRHSVAKAVAMVTTVLGLFFLHTIEGGDWRIMRDWKVPPGRRWQLGTTP